MARSRALENAVPEDRTPTGLRKATSAQREMYKNITDAALPAEATVRMAVLAIIQARQNRPPFLAGRRKPSERQERYFPVLTGKPLPSGLDREEAARLIDLALSWYLERQDALRADGQLTCDHEGGHEGPLVVGDLPTEENPGAASPARARPRRNLPEVAPGFYWEDERGKRNILPCLKCGKRANIRIARKDNDDLYWCARCWAFMP